MKFKLEVVFTNPDESLYTNEEASVFIDVEATDERAANIVGAMVTKRLGGDVFFLKSVV